MTESSTMLEQAEGGVVAEVAAAHHLNEDANAAEAEMEQAEGKFVVEAAATRNFGDDATATAAYNLGEDANAAATKEKAKKTGDMPRSQNNETEKDQWRRRRNQKAHRRKKKHCERRQTPT